MTAVSMSARSVSQYRLRNGLQICRILNGMWQVSGSHGAVDRKKASQEMLAYYDAGLTTFDMADIYGPAEVIFGDFLQHLREERGEHSTKNVQALTKWVPNPATAQITKKAVERYINMSMRRMGVEVLDMVQFHWWDYPDKRYLDALGYLAELQDEGKITELSLTNFNTEHLQNIVDKGIKISSNQVQFSLIDQRPLVKMVPFCEANGIKLLAYGVLGGGLLTDRYIGSDEPVTHRELNTASLSKYKQMVDAWGSWKLFQELLEVLSGIAREYNVSVANIAERYILEQTAVAGIILGCRFGVPGTHSHIKDNTKVFDFALDKLDIEKLESVCKKGNDLFSTTGDCGDEYRN